MVFVEILTQQVFFGLWGKRRNVPKIHTTEFQCQIGRKKRLIVFAVIGRVGDCRIQRHAVPGGDLGPSIHAEISPRTREIAIKNIAGPRSKCAVIVSRTVIA